MCINPKVKCTIYWLVQNEPGEISIHYPFLTCTIHHIFKYFNTKHGIHHSHCTFHETNFEYKYKINQLAR